MLLYVYLSSCMVRVSPEGKYVYLPVDALGSDEGMMYVYKYIFRCMFSVYTYECMHVYICIFFEYLHIGRRTQNPLEE